MLLSKIKERWASRRTSKGSFDYKKRVQLFSSLQKFIPVLSFILFIVGLGWILLLPYDGYSKQTYISENALLPGQVNLNYGYNDIRTAEEYREKLITIQDKDSETRAKFIYEEFRRTGFVSAIQHFTIDGKNLKMGANAFAINRAPRSDGKEALILSASWKSRTGEYNTNGIAALLSLSKLFKRNVYWAKDVILLVTDEGKLGTQAWLDAYHGTIQNGEFSSIVMPRSGAIQGVVNLDFPGTQDYETLGFFFEGVNGQLPNLDLINTMVAIATRTHPVIQITLHDNAHNPFEAYSKHNYFSSLNHLLRSMKYLAIGRPSSEAGLYLRYTIDAVTIHGITGSENLNQLFGFNRIGRLVESTFRSLNNLLEHFHQSFFFYLLPQPNRYISISQYMPPVIIFACSLIFYSLSLYYLGTIPSTFELPEDVKKMEAPPAYTLEKRSTLFAFTVLIITHITGIIIFNVMQPSFGWKYLNQFTENETIVIQYSVSAVIAFVSVLFVILWVNKSQSPEHDGTILKSFCLAQSALVIATVSLLNYTLGIATAFLILVPSILITPSAGKGAFIKFVQLSILLLLSPIGLAQVFSYIGDIQLTDLLSLLLSDYQVVHSWFLTYVCTVYWPMNMAMIILVFTKSIS